MSDADYKHKYFDLRAKFLKATDTAWRLGYENGLKDAQMQQMQQQQQEAQLAAQQAAQMGQDPNAQPQEQGQIGQPQDDSQGQSVQDPNTQPDQAQAQGPQEGEDHLGQSMDELNNAVQKSELVSRSQLADYNLDANAKRANNMQKKIVEDIMKKWEEETPRTINDILRVVNHNT